MSLSNVFSVDGILRAVGVEEEDIATFRTIRNTLVTATFGLMNRIYQEYRALTPEQRRAIGQNLIQGANLIAQEIHNAATDEEIRHTLQQLAAPTLQPALPSNSSHYSSVAIEGRGTRGYNRYARGNTLPHRSVVIEELEDESPSHATITYRTPSVQTSSSSSSSASRSLTAHPYSTAHNSDEALELAIQASLDEYAAQQASRAATQPSSSSSSSSLSSASSPTTHEEGTKFRGRPAKRSSPEKPSKVTTTPVYVGEGDDDPAFKKAMEEAMAESLQQTSKPLTLSFNCKNTQNQKKRNQDDQDDDAKPLSTKRTRFNAKK